MGGRGRGASRGNSKSILDSLGLQKGDVLNDRVQSPTETFPPLQFPPPKPTETSTPLQNYPLMVKKEMREHLINSQYHIKLEKPFKIIEHYSDKYLALLNVNKPLTLDWTGLPKELHPPKVQAAKKIVPKRKSATVKPNLKKRKIKEENISDKLDQLVKKEDGAESEMEDDPEKAVDEGEKGGEDGEELEELEEEQDEEMDEGTDYFQSYFDNGEADDDDDDLEEGGVM